MFVYIKYAQEWIIIKISQTKDDPKEDAHILMIKAADETIFLWTLVNVIENNKTPIV